MMNYSHIISRRRFLRTRAGFSARDLLERLDSPRLRDMPRLAAWIDGAADEAGVSRELMCVIPQKEQSALTARSLSDWALEAFCGYGVPASGQRPKPEWRGPRNQLYHAAKRLRWLHDRARETSDLWIARAGEPFAPAGITPKNAATAALYTYTPGSPTSHGDKDNFIAIWIAFAFGDPLAEGDSAMRLIPPIRDFDTATINHTLHGRSRHRPENVSGHNVVKGYSSPGVGDALDIEGVGWQTPVVAVCDGRITRWEFDAEKLEYIYLQGDGITAVYAHIDYAADDRRKQFVGRKVEQGEVIGVVRGDLNWDHLHFELWIDGRAVAGQSPEALRRAMLAQFGRPQETPELLVVAPGGKIIECHPAEEGGVSRGDIRPLVQALGYQAHYRLMQPGNRPRIYIKPAVGARTPTAVGAPTPTAVGAPTPTAVGARTPSSAAVAEPDIGA